MLILHYIYIPHNKYFILILGKGNADVTHKDIQPDFSFKLWWTYVLFYLFSWYNLGYNANQYRL